MIRRAIVHIDSRDGSRHVEVKGRNLWALGQLAEAGKLGITSGAYAGVRVAAHVHNLRKAGLEIETVHEAHRGAFPGTHARYVLHSIARIERASEPEQVA